MRNEVTVWLGQVKKACLAGIKLKLAIGRLVREAIKGGYHTDLGFSNMEEYVDSANAKGEFPCQKREAWECLKVVNAAEELKIKDAALYNISMVKLKDIFSLSTAQFADKIRELIADPITVTEHFEDTKLKVKAIKAGKDVAQVLAESKDATAVKAEEAAKKGETAELSKFSFTFTPANAAVVERALALFGTDRKESLLKMCAAAIAAHTTTGTTEAAPEKAMAAGA